MNQTYLILGEVFFAASNTHSPERKGIMEAKDSMGRVHRKESTMPWWHRRASYLRRNAFPFGTGKWNRPCIEC